MKKFLLAAAAAMTLSFGAAQAADMPAKPFYKAPAQAGYNWAGGYGGFALGYGWDPNYSVTAGSLGTLPMGLEPSGPFLGFLIGQNFIIVPQWIAGWEADFQYAWIRDYFSYDSGSDHIGVTVNNDMFGTLRGRWGYVSGPSMFFTTAGFAFGRFNFDGGVNTDTTAGGFNDKSKWAIGYVVGAGWEQAFANNWRGRFEYQFIDYNSFNVTSPNTAGGGVATIHADPQVHLVKFVFVRPFGTP